MGDISLSRMIIGTNWLMGLQCGQRAVIIIGIRTHGKFVRYIYADRKGDFFFAAAGEWMMRTANEKSVSEYVVIQC